MRVEQIIGSRAPLHVTAVGKLLLATDGKTAIKSYAETSTQWKQFAEPRHRHGAQW